jgi:hypothetical protein
MLRRFWFVSLATAIAAPFLAIAPASAVVLFSCNSVSGAASFTPGLGHTQTAQTLSATAVLSGCSNEQTATIAVGSESGLDTVATLPETPLGCPESTGGAGPDYANQTPVLVGGDPSFSITWSIGPPSTGIAKLKAAGPGQTNDTMAKVVFTITAGQYAPPSGQQTKLKGLISFSATDSYTCGDDSDPIGSTSFTGYLFVKQV